MAIYTYEQLKGVIKVGDKVRAAGGDGCSCTNLNDGKIGTITGVEDGKIYKPSTKRSIATVS